MNDRLNAILQDGENKIAEAKTVAELQDVKAALIGKQGALTEILKEVPKMEASLRAETGRAANQVKTKLTALIESRAEEIQLKA
ncbi:MAG: phenylalanine--tRNA ligase subunit alpha, partial [Defluviitaleaceae bacterium]|nr:phenylalanine--tRNA ligase subunit alpha [Defluviitaleaceae bacterium]